MNIREISEIRALAASGAARSIRLGARVSLRELARSAEVSPAALSRWERGLRVPHGDGALRWYRALRELMAR